MNGDDTNAYNRSTLDNAVWEELITKIPQKYGVADMAIHKVYKPNDIPKPPTGNWDKLKIEEKMEGIPLMASQNVPIEQYGIRAVPSSDDGIKEGNDLLSFKTDDDKLKVINAVQEIAHYNIASDLHKVIQEHKKTVSEWNKNNDSIEGKSISVSDYKYRYSSMRRNPPQLAGVISKESLPRAYKFLDILIKKLEILGCKINPDLSIEICGETVIFEMYELQSKSNHELTKQEIKAMKDYETAIKQNTYAHKPQIRKYDYSFNGRLCFSPKEFVCFRDSKDGESKIEDKLDKIIVDLYEEAEIVRAKREKREEEQRKHKEEEQRKESIRERCNQEVEQIIALENEAEDWAIACNIRAYVHAVETQDGSNEKKDWIEWAKAKADWYDPTISRQDEILGKRAHSLTREEKTPKKRFSWLY